jgi:hypothetical protein
MKSKKQLKLGDRVIDTWYPEAGTGVITEVLKTRTKVYFERATFKGGWQCPLFRGAKANGLLTYDRPHYRFLEHEH